MSEYLASEPQLQLLGTQGCHLCDDAEQLLQACLDLSVISVELVDIAESDALMEAYALHIPVLRQTNSDTTLAWPFNTDQVLAMVATLGGE